MVDDNPDRVILLTDKQLNRPFWIFKQFVLSEDVLTNRFLNQQIIDFEYISPSQDWYILTEFGCVRNSDFNERIMRLCFETFVPEILQLVVGNTSHEMSLPLIQQNVLQHFLPRNIPVIFEFYIKDYREYWIRLPISANLVFKTINNILQYSFSAFTAANNLERKTEDLLSVVFVQFRNYNINQNELLIFSKLERCSVEVFIQK